MDDPNKSTGTRGRRTIFREIESEDFGDKYDVKKLYLGIRRHWLLIFFSMLLWAALGWLAMNYLTSQYKAEATVLYQGRTQSQTLVGGTTLPTSSMSTVIDMILLPQNLQTLKSILGLDIPTATLEGMIEVPVPKNESNLIRIVVTGTNRNLAIDIANTLAKISVKKSQELYAKQLGLALESYKKELEETQLNLNGKIKEIEDFKSHYQYFEMTAEHTQKLTEINETRSKLNNAINNYNSLLVEYENLKREAATLPEKLLTGSMSGGRGGSPDQTKLLSLQSTLAEARLRYSDNNPKIKLLEEEINRLTKESKPESAEEAEVYGQYERNTLKDRLGIELMKMQGRVRASQKLKQDLQEQVVEMEKRLQNLPEIQMKFAKLLQQKVMTENQIKFLNESIQAIKLQLNVPFGSIEIYQLADKAKPRREGGWLEFIPFMGGLFGFFFGIGSSIVREMQDKRLCTSKQLEIKYRAPCYIEIPEISFFGVRTAEESMLFFIRNLSEAIDRTYKELPKKTGAMTVTITSAGDGEGKSCLSYLLASYYVRLGLKTLLIEFDDDKNPFTASLPKPYRGIEGYLRGETDSEQIIVKGALNRISNLSSPYDMKELVKSVRMQQLMEKLQSDYQVIIIDAPGVLKEDYTVNLLQFSDIKLFVIGSTESDEDRVDDSLKILELVNEQPTGFVLNRIQPLYIDDERIKKVTKSNRSRLFKKIITPWK